MESGQMKCTFLAYIQFMPSIFSLLINYLNKKNFDFYTFHLHFTSKKYCVMSKKYKTFFLSIIISDIVVCVSCLCS